MALTTTFEQQLGPVGPAQAMALVLGEVDVSPPGHALTARWAPVAGATGAEVASATVAVSPTTVRETLRELPIRAFAAGFELTLPPGKPVVEIALDGLRSGNVALPSARELADHALRLVVTLPGPDGAYGLPAYAVPSVPGRKMLPASLTGASYGGGVLVLPAVSARKLLLRLATGNSPDTFDSAPMALAGAHGQAAVPAADLILSGPDGQPVWAFPGPFPPSAQPATVDLRVSAEAALKAAAGAPGDAGGLVASWTLAASNRAKAMVSFRPPRGALLRAAPGNLRVRLTGDPAPLDLGGPLAAERPSAAVADLSVRYDGLRLVEELSDKVPPDGGAGGLVVGADPIVRQLPPRALAGADVARVGLIGRAPLETELSVQLLDAGGGSLGSPGVARLKPANRLATAWVEVPPTTGGAAPAAVAARANSGRFLWAAGTAPLLRVAVRDPAPGARPLRLDGTVLCQLGDAAVTLPGATLPVAAFQGDAPLLDSSLFLTVDLSDITLRYAR